MVGEIYYKQVCPFFSLISNNDNNNDNGLTLIGPPS